MTIASTNAKLRKCPVKGEDLLKVQEMIPRMPELHRVLIMHSTKVNKLQKELDSRYQQRKAGSQKEAEGWGDSPFSTILDSELRQEIKDLKAIIGPIRHEYHNLSEESARVRLQLPNFTSPKSPIGSMKYATIVGKGGVTALLPEGVRKVFEDTSLPISLKDIAWPKDASNPDENRDHLNIAKAQGWIDLKVNDMLAGTSWPVLCGPLAALEHALVNYALSEANKANFTPVVVPDVVRRDIIERTGFSPREGAGGQTYWISPDASSADDKAVEDLNDLALAATAEIPLAGMFAKKVFNSESELPQRYVASSHAFRAEAGARGHESRGLYRVHQFTKVEMFVVCKPSDSEVWLERLRSIQEGIISKLGIPYRVLNMPTEELGSSAYAKYDIEAWMPGRGSWGEVSSASNCTEYQAARLHIRYTSDRMDKPSFAHTLNGTAIAVPRIIVALLENYGISETGKLRVPSVLRQYWHASRRDKIEWFEANKDKSEHKTMLQSAIDRIRKMSEKSGTDTASLVLSFLILHELTAILPLILLFYLLGLFGVGEQVMAWLLQVSDDDSGIRGWLRGKINEGMQRAERYGRKKGFFGFEAGTLDDTSDESSKSTSALVGTFANAVAAYAITKALFPLRIGASIALAGPFARVFIQPLQRTIRRGTYSRRTR